MWEISTKGLAKRGDFLQEYLLPFCLVRDNKENFHMLQMTARNIKSRKLFGQKFYLHFNYSCSKVFLFKHVFVFCLFTVVGSANFSDVSNDCDLFILVGMEYNARSGFAY